MSKRTDTNEAAIFEGTVTIKASANPSEHGEGNLELAGALFADTIRENTDNTGVDVEGVIFQDKHFTLENIPAPTNPALGFHTIYLDDADNLLKSRNSTGNVTIYQPNNTKGDILTHNGTVQARLPVGTNGYILQADSTAITGLKWVDVDTSVNDTLVLIGNTTDNSVIVLDNTVGVFYIGISTKTRSGPISIFFATKSDVTNNGHIVQLLQDVDILVLEYQPYEGPRIYKEILTEDGQYIKRTNVEGFTDTQVLLIGTAWVSIPFTQVFGAYSLSISNQLLGPSATFLSCKSTDTHITGNIIKISSAPGTDNSVLEMRWTASSVIEIRKTSSNYDGIYTVVDNFEKSVNGTLTLSGTSPVDIPNTVYEKKSYAIKITSDISGYPCSIFYTLKNTKTVSGTRFNVFSPADITLEKITVSWPSLSMIKIEKTGTNYDGVYNYSIY